MFLYNVFPPELIVIGLESINKDEVFKELVEKFYQTQKACSQEEIEEILKALWERESKMSTGIQKGIAIPHGKTSALEKIHGVLGISKKGIDYDALDSQPVYAIFMLLTPKNDSENYLRLLKRLSGLLDNRKFYLDLLSQNDPESANQVIRKYEMP